MSSIELLDRTRRIRTLLHDNEKNKVSFDEICSLMCSIVPSSVCVISAKGKVLGRDARAMYPDAFGRKKGAFIDDSLNERLLRVLSTRENVRLDTSFSTTAAEAEGMLDEERFVEMVRAFGADRILFGTDGL